MTLRHMKIFLAVYQTQHITKAAQQLRMTQPAVTRAIQEIEGYYGIRLFERINRKLYITETGRMFYTYAVHIVDSFDQMEKGLRDWDQLGVLRVGTTIALGTDLLPRVLVRFQQSHPGLQVRSVVSNGAALQKALLDNELDFAVVEGYFSKTHFEWQLFRQEPFVGICHKNHPFCGRKVGLPELLTATIIHREAGSGTRAILEQKLKGYNESLERFDRHICISSFKLILDAVKQNLGVSFVYEALADSDPQLGKFWMEGDPIIREFNIVYLKNTDPQEKIRLFLQE